MPTGIKSHRTQPKSAKKPGRNPQRTIPLNTARWQKLRAAVLAQQPLCAHCSEAGILRLATDVDHADNDPANNDPANLQPLCHACHSRKTARERGGRVGYGCDANGMPLDPAHPWNRNRHEPTAVDRPSSLTHATAKQTAQKIGNP